MNGKKIRESMREGLSAVAQLFGAFIFAAGLMPILNPAKCGIEPGHMLLMLILVLCLCGAGLLVMFLGRRAQRDLQKESPRTETAFQKKLKWILLGLVALILVLSAMF